MWIVLVCSAAILTAWPVFDDQTLAGDLLGQARLHLSAVLLLFLLLVLWRGKYLPAVAIVSCLIFNGFWISSAFPVREVKSASAKTLKVLSFNVFKNNDNYRGIAAMIRQQDADIVWLLEAKRDLFRSLSAELGDSYPIKLSGGDERIVQSWIFLSKYPVEKSAEAHSIPGSSRRVLFIPVQYDNRMFHFLGLHNSSPKSSARVRRRNIQIDHVADFLIRNEVDSAPLIVAGDMNTVPWRPRFRQLLKLTGLYTSTRVWDMALSWPSHLPFPLAIPIDHILHNKYFCLKSNAKVDSTGSDHYPVVASLSYCNLE